LNRDIVNKAGKITGIRILFNEAAPASIRIPLKTIIIWVYGRKNPSRFCFTATFNYFGDFAGGGHNSLILLILKEKGLNLFETNR
jgi:hypothetical protein